MAQQFYNGEPYALASNQLWKVKQFCLKIADIDSIDIEIDSSDPEEIVKV